MKTPRPAVRSLARVTPAPEAGSLTRRTLLQAAGIGTLALQGCDTALFTGPGPGSGPGDDDAQAAADAQEVADAGLPDATPACAETDDNLEGPFYLAGAPARSALAAPEQPGVAIEIRGVVYSRGVAACLPIAGALLDVWHSDDRGATPSTYSPTADGFLRGTLQTADDGSYTFTTIIPGHYLNGAQFRPAHIHVKASAAGHGLLTTQLYFAGDEWNAIDPFIEPRLIMTVVDHPTRAGKLAIFDFVLRAG